MPPAHDSTLRALAERAERLCSPPAVALEVLRLADQPRVDARALCAALESDPALAGRVLRVVNSPLYGLPREVGSLTQAIALLGVRPLKLLVLGFAVPDTLTASLHGESLRRYWTETLTVAAAARLFAELGGGRLGDEALAAGLLQRVGVLAMMAELGDDYARLLESANAAGGFGAVERAEREALGFDHVALSAELLRRWRLPSSLVAAVEAQGGGAEPTGGEPLALARALRLANLVARLALDRDLEAMRPILELGREACGLTPRGLNSLVAALEERVAPLARSLAAPILEGIDYRQPLVEAQARLALLAEAGAVRMLGDARSSAELDEDERLCRDLLLETRRLAAAARVLLAGGLEPRTDAACDAPPLARRRHAGPRNGYDAPESLIDAACALVASCREARRPLSLALVQATAVAGEFEPDVEALRHWIQRSPRGGELAAARWAPITRDRAAVWLAGVERIEAARLWTAVAAEAREGAGLALDIGVAGVTCPAPRFDPRAMLDAAARCLDAAINAAGPTVKSIEVF